jgi:hypothetical protein
LTAAGWRNSFWPVGTFGVRDSDDRTECPGFNFLKIVINQINTYSLLKHGLLIWVNIH